MNTPAVGEQSKNKVTFQRILLDYSALIILVILVIASAFLSDKFLSVRNIMNVLRQQVPYFLIGMGVMLCILTGGIDLSAGATLGVGSVVVALVLVKMNITSVAGLWFAILVATLVGVALGAFNGLLVARFKMAPFIATLSTMTIGQGLAFLLSNGQPIRMPVDASRACQVLVEFGEAMVGPVPAPVFVALFFILLFFFLMKFTAFGRLIIASGSNETSVRLSGINVGFYKFMAYAICGGLSAIGGVVVTARAAIATPQAAMGGYELDAIAAVVIGGASLEGGRGSVLNTVVGVLIIALIGNIMNLLSVAAYPQKIMKGLIIIAAVLLKSYSDKKAAA